MTARQFYLRVAGEIIGVTISAFWRGIVLGAGFIVGVLAMWGWLGGHQ